MTASSEKGSLDPLPTVSDSQGCVFQATGYPVSSEQAGHTVGPRMTRGHGREALRSPDTLAEPPALHMLRGDSASEVSWMGKAGVTWLATGSPQGWCCSQGWPRGTTAHRQCPSPLYLQGRHSAFRLSTEESKDSRDRTSLPQTPVHDGRLETTVTTGCVSPETQSPRPLCLCGSWD